MKHIDIGYELWDRGYRLNTRKMSEKDCYKKYSEFDCNKTFDDFFEQLNAAGLLINEAEEQARYKEENEPKLQQFFHKYIEGKSFDEIDPNNWDWYSDWHKDVYGYRPHGIVCGIYVNPHSLT